MTKILIQDHLQLCRCQFSKPCWWQVCMWRSAFSPVLPFCCYTQRRL